MDGQKAAICRRRRIIRSATGGRRTKAMSEPIRHSNGSQVLDDIRRALGRSETVKPPPLERFVEALEPENAEELFRRFTAEINAVGAQLYQARNSEEVGARVA